MEKGKHTPSEAPEGEFNQLRRELLKSAVAGFVGGVLFTAYGADISGAIGSLISRIEDPTFEGDVKEKLGEFQKLADSCLNYYSALPDFGNLYSLKDKLKFSEDLIKNYRRIDYYGGNEGVPDVSIIIKDKTSQSNLTAVIEYNTKAETTSNLETLANKLFNVAQLDSVPWSDMGSYKQRDTLDGDYSVVEQIKDSILSLNIVYPDDQDVITMVTI